MAKGFKTCVVSANYASRAGVGGRPSSYNVEISKEICERLANGEALYAICKEERYPKEATIKQWAIENRDGFGER